MIPVTPVVLCSGLGMSHTSKLAVQTNILLDEFSINSRYTETIVLAYVNMEDTFGYHHTIEK